jgi:hypothetical protein
MSGKLRNFSHDSLEFRQEAVLLANSGEEFEFWTDFEAALRRRMEAHFGESESGFNNRHRGSVGVSAARDAQAISGPGAYDPWSVDVGSESGPSYARLLPLGERDEVGRPSVDIPAISVQLDARTLESASERLARVIAELDRTINVLIALNKRHEESYL